VATARDTEVLILREARTMLEESGESAFRVTELARRCDIAVSLLYHYFRDRDGLLAAARQAQFVARIEEDVARMTRVVTDEHSLADVLSMIIDDFCDPRNEERRLLRLDRMEVLAATRHDPALCDRLTRAQSSLSVAICDAVDKAKADGMLDPRVDTKAFSFLLEVIPLGTGLSEVYGSHLPDDDKWKELLLRILVALMPPDAQKP
jgi:AcrR family transcriptional regulator